MTLAEAIQLRSIIELAGTRLTDEEIVLNPLLAPRWKTDVYYSVDDRVFYSTRVYKCIQAHSSLETYTPDAVPALWEVLDEVHTGADIDPKEYTLGMALEADMYYTQYDVLYRCFRDTGNPVYHDLSALVGLYVEVVE